MNKWGITAKLLLVPVMSMALLVLAIAFTGFTQTRYNSVARSGVEHQIARARLYSHLLERLERAHTQYLDLATAQLAGVGNASGRRGLPTLVGDTIDLCAALDEQRLDDELTPADSELLRDAARDLYDFQDVEARLMLARDASSVRADVVESNAQFSRMSQSLAALLSDARSQSDLALRQLEAHVRRALTILVAVMLLVGGLAAVLTVWARRAITQPLATVARAMRHFHEHPHESPTVSVPADDEIGEIAAGFNELMHAVRQREGALQASAEQLRTGNETLQAEVRDRRIAEAQLRRSRELLELAQAAGGVGVFDVDLDERCLRGSPQFFELQGLPPATERLSQDQWLALVHPDDLESLVGAYSAAVDAGGAYRVEYRIVRPDRAVRWVMSAGCVITGGSRWRVVGSLTDITERKQSELALAAAEARLARAVHGTSDGVYEYNVTSQQLWLAPRTAELLGHDPARFTPSLAEWNARVHPGDLDARREALRAHLERGQPYDVEFRVLDARDEWQWMRSRGEAHRDPATDSIILSGSLQLVTDRRRQAAELERARAAAEQANRAKSDFLANMSHEIRTPINGVIGMTHVLLDSPLQPAQRECVEILRSSGEALLALVNDVLDVSKIEAGRLELEQIDVEPRAVADDAIGAVAVTALDKDLDLAVSVAADVPRRVRGDPGRLRQCLVNLLGNAIKFTDRGEVTLAVSLDRLDGASAVVRFTVEDSGIGIAPERFDRLFRQFSQVDSSTTRHFGGTGLGLSIVKHLSALMGGEVGVDSTPGAGSRFWFTARLEVLEAAARPVAGSVVCIAAARPATARQLARQLEALGHAPVVCTSAGDLAAEVAGAAAAVTLVDARLPAAVRARVLAAARGTPPPSATVLLCPLGGAPGGEATDAVLALPVRSRQLDQCLARVLHGRPAAAGDAPRAPHALAPRRVLLVEDNPVNRRVAEHLLARLGCEVGCAANGVEAVERAAAGGWDLILMDCQMPVMDGYAATRAIRAREAPAARVAIVALTANALDVDREACRAAGMDDFLAKPLDPAALAACLAEWAQRRPAADAMPGAPIDLAALHAAADGDAGFERELIDLFIASGDATLAELRAALARGDLPEVRRHAHTLKGASAHLRAEPLARTAQAVETAAADGDLDGCRSATRALEDDYARTARFASGRRL